MFARIAADHIPDDAGTYYDYVHKTRRKALRPSNVEGLEPFREFYRQVFVLGSERSTILFTEKLVALFPLDARPWILLWQSGVDAVAHHGANAQRKEELLRPKAIATRMTLCDPDATWTKEWAAPAH